MGEKILLRHEDVPNLRKLSVYEKDSGYGGFKKALTAKPDELIEQVKASGLRGRGGAGFPTGLKWSFLPKDSPKPRYLLVNADESEPGTFKDRAIIELNPHLLIEGALISAYAIRCHTVYIYIRGEFAFGAKVLEEAIREAYAAGHLGKNVHGSGFDVDMYVHRGAGAYICGEETGLIESLEGKRAYPRVKPPFPATYGVFGCPTIVNNVETLACVPMIITRGAAWFKSIGPEKGPGPKLYCISGHVQKPGVYEAPMGTSLRVLLDQYAGGMRGGKKLKAVIPGGSSVPLFTPDQLDTPMDFDSVAAAGSLLGSCGIIVMDEDTCMVNALEVIARFYHHESCGQCTPCREGTGWLHRLLRQLEFGGCNPRDLQTLMQVADNMMGTTVCVLSDAAAMPVKSFVTKFRQEFEDHLHNDGCPHRTGQPRIAAAGGH